MSTVGLAVNHFFRLSLVRILKLVSSRKHAVGFIVHSKLLMIKAVWLAARVLLIKENGFVFVIYF